MKIFAKVKHIKYNKVVLQSPKYVDEVTEMFRNFFNEVKKKLKDLEGFAIMKVDIRYAF